MKPLNKPALKIRDVLLHEYDYRVSTVEMLDYIYRQLERPANDRINFVRNYLEWEIGRVIHETTQNKDKR